MDYDFTPPTKLIIQFAEGAAKTSPCWLVAFNLADTKRRNAHLGHIQVDADIDLFDKVLNQVIAPFGGSRRVAGDLWLSFAELTPKEWVPSVVSDYCQKLPILIGWRTEARLANQRKSEVETVYTTIERAFRCVCEFAPAGSNVENLCTDLLEGTFGQPVNSPVRLSEAESRSGQQWRCVGAYPEVPQRCAFCKGTDFEWGEGDSHPFAADGYCKGCRAYNDFRPIEDLLSGEALL